MFCMVLNSGTFSLFWFLEPAPTKNDVLGLLLLMIEILHDFIYQRLRNNGGIVYTDVCRTCHLLTSLGPWPEKVSP